MSVSEASDCGSVSASVPGLSHSNSKLPPLDVEPLDPSEMTAKKRGGEDRKRGKWTAEEDEMLRKAVAEHHGKNWKKIAQAAFGESKSDVQCLHRWQKVLDPKLVKGPWTKAEDAKVIELVEKLGPKKWSVIAGYLPGRIGKQCRERW